MTPQDFYTYVLSPGLVRMSRVCDIPMSFESAVLLMAIAGTESNWTDRLQFGGPARSFLMFERNGVMALMQHPVSEPLLQKLADSLEISFATAILHEAVAWCDPLAVGMARLLLWTDARQLPALGDWDLAYLYYERNWKPGKPDLARFQDRYATALRIVVPDHGTGAAVA
jgi:hypothetical protein